MPQPVGPISRMLHLAISTSSARCSAVWLVPWPTDALVVVVDRDRRARAWRAPGRRRTPRGRRRSRAAWADRSRRRRSSTRPALFDDLVAQLDALVADVDAGAGDQLLHLLLALAAERALEQVGALTDACHIGPLLGCRRPRCRGSRSLNPEPNPLMPTSGGIATRNSGCTAPTLSADATRAPSSRHDAPRAAEASRRSYSGLLGESPARGLAGRQHLVDEAVLDAPAGRRGSCRARCPC